jgi:cation:H+ antiporter
MHDISTNHLVTALMSIMLTSITVIGLIYRSQRTFARLGYDSVAIALGYFLAITLLFLGGT